MKRALMIAVFAGILWPLSTAGQEAVSETTLLRAEVKALRAKVAAQAEEIARLKAENAMKTGKPLPSPTTQPTPPGPETAPAAEKPLNVSDIDRLVRESLAPAGATSIETKRLRDALSEALLRKNIHVVGKVLDVMPSGIEGRAGLFVEHISDATVTVHAPPGALFGGEGKNTRQAPRTTVQVVQDRPSQTVEKLKKGDEYTVSGEIVSFTAECYQATETVTVRITLKPPPD